MKSRRIPYGRQLISESDIEAVVSVLRSDWLTQGPNIEKFEKTVAQYCGAKYAVAVSNATAALHIACIAAGVGNGDSVWTSPNSFVASSNCALYCNGSIDFVDIDKKTYNMDPLAFERKVGISQKPPKVLIPVHFSGQSCDMERLWLHAKKSGATIIEDASHAIGGSYKNERIGSCRFSDMTIFSFHPVKIITTGEGGIITTNNPILYEKLTMLRSHGITRNTEKFKNTNDGKWYYEQQLLGYNYRMTDMQAALGTSQMQKLDEFVQRRRILALQYNQELDKLPVITPYQSEVGASAYHLYVIQLQPDKLTKNRAQVFEELKESGIDVNVHYIPIHTQPYYQKLGFKVGDFPEAERYYRHAISLPMHASLSDGDQNYVIETLKRVLK